MNRIYGTAKGTLPVDELPLEGIMIQGRCPKCKTGYREQWNGKKVSRPELEEYLRYTMYCKKCDFTFGIPVKLRLALEVKG